MHARRARAVDVVGRGTAPSARPSARAGASRSSAQCRQRRVVRVARSGRARNAVQRAPELGRRLRRRRGRARRRARAGRAGRRARRRSGRRSRRRARSPTSAGGAGQVASISSPSQASTRSASSAPPRLRGAVARQVGGDHAMRRHEARGSRASSGPRCRPGRGAAPAAGRRRPRARPSRCRPAQPPLGDRDRREQPLRARSGVRACCVAHAAATLRAPGEPRGIARESPTSRARRGVVILTTVRRGRARTRTRVAAVRDETPSLAKMFCTWRATVCSLITSSAAISRLLLPAATSRSTSSSRGVSPRRVAGAGQRVDARRRPAPRRAARRRSRAASSSSAAVSSSPSARHAEPDQHARPRRLVGRVELAPRLLGRRSAIERAARRRPRRARPPRARAPPSRPAARAVQRSAISLQLARRRRAPPRRRRPRA